MISENHPKKRKYSVSSSSLGENALLTSEENHQNWTTSNWKLGKILPSDESHFPLQYSDSRVRINNMNPSCLSSTVQAAACGLAHIFWILSTNKEPFNCHS